MSSQQESYVADSLKHQVNIISSYSYSILITSLVKKIAFLKRSKI
jgi:hypothetical protein